VEDFEKIDIDGVILIAVNLARSTINEAYEFRKIIEDEISAGHTRLIIDLSKCGVIDSTFFGSIIWALGLIADKGQQLKIIKSKISEDDIFTSTNTLSLFKFYKTRDEAIKSSEGDD
jgi:anti-anti-sigma regulatory factor